eukprot:Sspe_Gene.16554::Locus_5835_Transcript_2_2_Confidence_0.500_Length_790::g.16554::m.16554
MKLGHREVTNAMEWGRKRVCNCLAYTYTHTDTYTLPVLQHIYMTKIDPAATSPLLDLWKWHWDRFINDDMWSTTQEKKEEDGGGEGGGGEGHTSLKKTNI